MTLRTIGIVFSTLLAVKAHAVQGPGEKSKAVAGQELTGERPLLVVRGRAAEA